MRTTRIALLTAIAVLLVAVPSASASCLSSTPGSWTFSDPADQGTSGYTDIAALHVSLDEHCRISMWADIRGSFDPKANYVMYDLDIDGVVGFDRAVGVALARPNRPEPQLTFGVGSGSITYHDAPASFSFVGKSGWSGDLEDLGVTEPRPINVRLSIWEDPPVGAVDSVPMAQIPLSFVTGNDRPVNTALPAIGGNGDAGHVLLCAPGSWDGLAPISYDYQWLRDGKPVANATSTDFTTKLADTGHTIACRVTATNPAGQRRATSAPLLIVDDTAPLFRLSVNRRNGTLTGFVSESSLVKLVITRVHGGTRKVRCSWLAGSHRIERALHLRRGATYRITATAIDAEGNASASVAVSFRYS